jgi:GDP-L-fucose synthase
MGSGTDISIGQLAETMQKVVDHSGEIVWDKNKPDGTPRKLIVSSKMKPLGWKPQIPLKAGIQSTYQWFLENQPKFKQLKLSSQSCR